MPTDTGETTAAMNRREDDRTWPILEASLKAGATLIRPPRLSRYYIDWGNGAVGGGSLTATRVRKLEAAGVLRHVGVDRYGLGVTACPVAGTP